MKKVIFTILVISFFINPIYSQSYLNVLISNAVRGEECVSINPKNPDQIVVGICGIYTPLNTGVGAYYSTNGGMNWSGGPLVTNLGLPLCDPFVVVDTAGNFYCTTMGGVNNEYYLLCFRSTNGGMNWNDGTRFAQDYPKMNDMPMACVDFSNSQYRNNIYVTWTLYDSVYCHNPNDSSYVYFSRSSDQANTFSTPKRIGRIAGPSYSDNASPEGPVPCTGTNGEIYVCFPHDSLVYFNRSTDAGDTWLSDDIIVCPQPGGWFYHHSPVTVCDLSGSANRGNVYICFSDIRNGVNDRDIWFTKSTNRGVNWSNVVRVNDDSPGHNQELPWMCVDQVTGYIWVVFYDSRNYSSQSYSDVYVARSTDEGNTFQNGKVSGATLFMGYWYGDYMGISAYNNKVRPVWTRYINGLQNNMYTAIMDTFYIGIQPISNQTPKEFTLYQNYPNPFNPTTKIKFDVSDFPLMKGVRGMSVRLTVYDLLGREVATLVNQQLKPGTYEIEFDGSNYPSGVYFYRLSASEYTQTMKMVLLK